MSRIRSRELFPTDAPLGPDQLIGRSGDVAALRQELAAGVHQVVLGARRTGKTSVCRSALDQLADEGCYVVGLDLFALSSRTELAAALVGACVANRGPLTRGARRVRTAGRALAAMAGVTLTARLQAELGQDVEIAFTPALASRDPQAALEYALTLPQRIAETDDVHLVLFVDEFQEIAHPRRPFGDPDELTKRLRAVLQNSDRVTALFTGSADHLMHELFVPPHRAFYRFGVTRRLSPIGDGEWLTGLTDRFELDAVSCAPGALEVLLERTGGHPRSTMLMAQQAHLSLLANGTRTLTLAAVEEGYYAAMAADSIGHQSEAERIRSLSAGALSVARRIARGERPYTGSPRTQVDRALRQLLEAGVVERPERGEYVFTDPLLAHYLSRL